MGTVIGFPDSVIIGQTDWDGLFPVPDDMEEEASIEVHYTGYDVKRTKLKDLREKGFRMRLKPGKFFLNTAVVIGRRNEKPEDLTQQVNVIDKSEIARAQSLTTADALADLGGIYVQKSQFGGGSPVVRGFEANRVLLVVDGVRMNNAIFRGGHLQNAITVDPLALDRLEIIYGAGALAYGSDAIGGVVHFRTQEPEFRARTQDAVNGQIAMNVSSAANAVTVGGKLNYGAKNWAGLTLLSTTSTSHLRSGGHRPSGYPNFGLRNEYVERRDGQDVIVQNDDPNVQVGTAYSQFNLLQKFRFRLQDKLELSANVQFSTSTDIPRYDALIEHREGQLRFARWDYGPQTRALGALRLNDRRETAIYDIASYLLSYQFIEEDRISRRLNDPLEEHNQEDVQATNLQVDFTKSLNPKFILRYGFDLRYDRVESTAFIQDIVQGGNDIPGLATRYPSAGSSLSSGGLYAETAYDLSRDWTLRGGARLSRQRLSATFGADDPVQWPQTYLDGINNAESAVTATIGLRQKKGWRFLYSQGFRAPNIDDFAKFRERNGFIQVPNPTLQPERSNTLEAGYEFIIGERLSGQATVYHTWLKGAIVRRNGTLPDGSDFFVSRGDTLFAQTNVNADNVRVYGVDFSLRYRLNRDFRLATQVHALRGRRQQTAQDGTVLTLPQDHIPPPYGSTSMEFVQGGWSVNLSLRYQLAKPFDDYAVSAITGTSATGYSFDREGSSDNLELTPFLTDENRFAGAFGWWTVNVAAEFAPGEHWALRFKANNLLDKHYRTFASGVSAPGIDVGVGVSYRF